MQKQIKISIEENDYIIKFPNVGQYLDIENMKMALTDNRYADLWRSNLKTSFFAVRLVDAIATFWTLIPDLRKDLNVRTYTDLDPFLAKRIVKIYDQQFAPWYNKLMEELLKEEEENKLPDEEEDITIKL